MVTLETGVQKAVDWIAGELKANPKSDRSALIDQAGMRLPCAPPAPGRRRRPEYPGRTVDDVGDPGVAERVIDMRSLTLHADDMVRAEQGEVLGDVRRRNAERIAQT